MKKIYLLFSSLLISIMLYSQTSLVENFNYGDESNDLINVSPNWINQVDVFPYVKYATTSLTIPNYESTPVGGSITVVPEIGQSIGRPISSVNSGTVYLSALVNIQLAGVGDSGFFLHLNGTSNIRARVFVRDNGANGINFGVISLGNNASIDWGSTNYAKNTTYLVVAKYEFNTGTSKLYVLTAPTTNEPAVPEASQTAGIISSVSSVSIRQHVNGPLGKIDGLRVATNWSELMEAPMSISLNDDLDNGAVITVPSETANDANINFNTRNFVVASPSNGDGYIKWTMEDLGDNTIVDSGSIFTANDGVGYPVSNLAPGNTYFLRAELVDNLGNPLNDPKVYNLTLTIEDIIETVAIPDVNFEQALIDIGVDKSKILDGFIWKSEAEAVTALDLTSKNISDLTGVEAFINLTDLNCQLNRNLEHVNLSNNKLLTNLECRGTGISSLDVTNNGELKYLSCGGNTPMTNIDISNNTKLETFISIFGNLETIDVSQNTALTRLDLFRNKITSLDVSNNLNLTFLRIVQNQLSSLDVSTNSQLTNLNCAVNQLTSLDISKNTALLSLNCSDNNLTSLDVSVNEDLTSLICSRNQISSLNVEKNTKLIHLAIFDLPITEINLLKNKELGKFFANNNQLLSTIDFSQNSRLNQVTITNSIIKTLDLSNNPSLLFLRLYDNPQLAHFDIRNNNNTIVSRFDIWNTPNLTCINADANYDPLVDTEIPAEISQAMIDSGKTFSEDCGDFVEILDSNFTNISCNGANNGAINITVSNGLAPYVFEWTNSENPEFSSSNEDLAGLAPGTYQLLITDANGTTASLSGIIITEPVLLTATATGEALLCFGDSDGEINLTVSGGTAPYTYSWSNGSTVEDPSGLVVGDYTVVVTDANGCTTNLSASITEPELLVASIANESTICSNNAAVNVVGGTLEYTYLWSNGATTASINNVPVGTYDVTVTDANGCTTIASIDLTVGEAFNPSASVTDVTCFGKNDGVITVTNANGEAPFSFSIDGINFLLGEFPYSFDNLAADTYEIAVRDGNGCTGFITKTVSEPEELTATLVSVESTCFGQSTGAISVDASGGIGGLSYSWTGEGYASSQKNINGLASGTYTLTVTDNNECTTTLEVEVPTFDEIVVDANVINVSCRGELTGSIDLTVSGGSGSGFTYSWTGNIISTSQNISNLGAGVNYNVTITDIGNGCSVSKSYTITQPDTNLSLATTKTNASGCGDDGGTITATGSGGTDPYEYKLDDGVYQSSGMFSFLSGGTYIVWVKDSNGCTSSKEVIITDNGKDEWESNNSKKKAVEIGIGPTINGRIALANDVADWFKFDTSATGGKYVISLTHLSINFNLELYPDSKNAAALVPINSTTTNKEYQLTGGATYYVEITSTELSYSCYNLEVSEVTSTGKRGATKNQEIEINDLSVRAYPNPHKGSFNLSVKSPEEGMVQIQLFNVLGQLLSKREVFVVKGQETIVNFNDADRGMILYHIRLNGKNINGKLIGKD